MANAALVPCDLGPSTLAGHCSQRSSLGRLLRWETPWTVPGQALFVSHRDRDHDRDLDPVAFQGLVKETPLHGQSPAGPNETGGKANPPKTKTPGVLSSVLGGAGAANPACTPGLVSALNIRVRRRSGLSADREPCYGVFTLSRN